MITEFPGGHCIFILSVNSYIQMVVVMTMFNFLSRDTLTKEIEPTHGHLSMAQITGTELHV